MGFHVDAHKTVYHVLPSLPKEATAQEADPRSCINFAVFHFGVLPTGGNPEFAPNLMKWGWCPKPPVSGARAWRKSCPFELCQLS